MNEAIERIVLGPEEGDAVAVGGLGVRFMVGGEQSGGGFSLVEHPIAPRTLAAPMHSHQHEDEYTYVLEGEVGVQVGDEIRYAAVGDLVFKPRGIAHAFWNRRDEPARALEIISPGGFERYFAEIAPLLPPQRPEPDFEGLAEVRRRYGLEMDAESIETIAAREGLVLPA
ncbi:MAG TPA: cupin domain-containing protein [Solirubrobacteraceae bacterium]|nr:cupin domain-containing protein [Solirubrobacteraceae bacterium]